MFRLSTAADPEFLAEMLYEAVNWRESADEVRPALDDLLALPQFAHYVEGWGRPGDVALVALDRHDQPVGAAWYRSFPADDPGFGFVAADVPEVSIAVFGEYRRRGVGRLLLGALTARARAAGRRGLSLSVERENPARLLYARLGFEVVHEDDGTYTMLLDLREAGSG